ncbi:hypothetical protein [Silvimonas iriomotensis]|uniref:Transmembrane protein n=1 Tax=Silvimonas iriomotensis TaxID=449662 RepID=A0ABQ2P6D5_9NEIS|nr:hypothetical protein [Silvimonas iriomotensis]GGP19353.1 hypothetical protein GCM10010970_10190 [Silvimonas iriomotensis]
MKVYDLRRAIRRYRVALLIGALIGAVWGSRHTVESRMWLHMLGQFPVLVLGGVWLGARLPLPWQRKAALVNRFGLSGLVFASLVTAFWMIPAALDQAVAQIDVDALKMLVLVAAGLALQQSWHVSGRALQAYFLITWSMMTVTIGLIFQDPAARLCNYYRLDDQQIAGYGLVFVGAMIVAIWFWQVVADTARAKDRGLDQVIGK